MDPTSKFKTDYWFRSRKIKTKILIKSILKNIQVSLLTPPKDLGSEKLLSLEAGTPIYTLSEIGPDSKASS